MKKGKPHRIEQVHNRIKFLEVLSDNEQKTSTIRKKAIKKYPEYDLATIKWFRDILNSYAEDGIVEKVNKEDEIADYWTITEDGIKKRDQKEE